MSARIILAGCGNMGFAMLKGWLDTAVVAPGEVLAVEPNEALRARAAALGVPAVAGADEIGAAEAPELVVLAVKPQVMREALGSYRRFGNGSTTFLSIAAGTPIATLTGALGADTPALRAMPNLPAAVGKGVIGLFAGERVPPGMRVFVERLLGASGTVVTVESEDMIDAFTAVSGSGPGYVFLFIEVLAQAAQKLGFSEQDALLLARDTVWGAGALVHEGGEHPAELRRQVTSVGGTTAAGLAVMMDGDRLAKAVIEGVEAALARAKALAKG